MEEKPMSWKRILFSLTACLALLLSACGGAAPQATQPPPATQPPAATQPAASAGGEQVTITVWDYYTDPNATPIQPLIAPFEKEYPNIKVNYEIMDWDTALEKLNVALTGGNPPDVTTVDMTWLPKFAALGAFTDLTTYLKGGMLNGVPLEQSYAPGALEAILTSMPCTTAPTCSNKKASRFLRPGTSWYRLPRNWPRAISTCMSMTPIPSTARSLFTKTAAS
jgi:ABC-type glycerol-3-phosphate transport system substrate-binding protein